MQNNQVCSICEQQPEQLLILACQHNLCVSCATEVYLINEKCNPFTCQICLEGTHLDQETIALLMQLTQRKVNDPTPPNLSKIDKLHKPPKSKKSKQTSIQHQQQNCHIHNQKILYYCFDCEGGDICSQCILTPKHSGHKVVTIKKAVNFITKRINEQIRQKQLLKDQLNAQRSKYMAVNRHIQDQMQEKKGELKEIFDNVIRAVTEYYAVLNASLEEQTKNVRDMVDGCLVQIQEKSNMLAQAIHYDSQFLKNKNQFQILNYFPQVNSQNYQLFYPQLPKQMPYLDIKICNAASVTMQMQKTIQKIYLDKSSNQSPYTNNNHNSFEFSVIRPQIMNDLADQVQDHAKVQTALKQSHKYNQDDHYSHSYKSYKNHNYSNNRNSRKLEMSRSIDNATYIINRLQQRSRNN